MEEQYDAKSKFSGQFITYYNAFVLFEWLQIRRLYPLQRGKPHPPTIKDRCSGYATKQHVKNENNTDISLYQMY